MATTPVQTRLPLDLVRRIDAHAEASRTTRAEVVRRLVEAAFADPGSHSTAPSDPQLDRLIDELGGLAARIDAALTASRNASTQATAAHAAARLGALMLLPADRQQSYIDKLSGVRP